MIPALRNWSTSPDPGCTTTATVSATSATSVSDWPTPTVSMTTTSNAAASAVTAARVAGARPPRRSPAAVERMNTPRSDWIRLDPGTVTEQRATGAPGGGVDGQHRHGATIAAPRREQPRQQRRLADPRGPGDPHHVGRGLAAELGGRDAGQQRGGLLTRVRGAALDEVQDGRGRGQVMLAQSARELAPLDVRRAQAPSVAEIPLRSATSETMSRIIWFRSQSLGV